MSPVRTLEKPRIHRSALPSGPRRPAVGVDPAAGSTQRAEAGAFAASDHEYRHLEPLLHTMATMAPKDPARERLREQVVTGYLPVAQHIAQRYAQRGEPLEDLVQVASLALVNAVDRYEPGRGHNFLGYAIPTITGEVRRHFRDKTWSMRVPRRLQELHLSVNKVITELSHELQRAPRPSEIATRLNLTTDEVLDALQVAQSYRADSLDELLNSDSNGASLGDRLGDTDARFEQFIEAHSLAPHLRDLPVRERSILIMRFFDEMTQTQIAEQIGISQMHVSRLLTKTLAQLRESVAEDPA
ncbi:MAG TPA: SigB/SigF/SigG family RNA polymerase sigma factor [Pseudonocardia sp.]